MSYDISYLLWPLSWPLAYSSLMILFPSHYAQGASSPDTSFNAIIENDDTVHKNYEDRGCALHSANYSHSSLQFPSRNASRRKRIWSTQEGSNFLLFASKISPAAEKSRSTAVDVAGAVRYLKKSFNANVRTIYFGYQGWMTHPAPQNTQRFWPLPHPTPPQRKKKAICYNSNNIEILPIICFWGHA